MQSQFIQLKKKRELGEIISGTFSFIRKNIKPIFKVLIRTLFIPFILLVVAVAFYSKVSAVADPFNFLGYDSFDIAEFLIAFSSLAIAGILYNAILYGSISEYIKAYNQTNGIPDINIVLKEVRINAIRYIGLAFANMVIVILVFIILAIPGILIISNTGNFLGILFILIAFIPLIYLYVRFSLIFPAIVNKSSSIFESFITSGKLIKDEWWNTFFTLFVIGLLIGVIGFVFQLPAAIYGAVKAFTSVQEGTLSDPSTLYDGITITLQTIGSAINYLLYIILAVAINFIYFNLNERKNQTGSLEKINTIGNTDGE